MGLKNPNGMNEHQIDLILEENKRRRQKLYGTFDPLSGEGSLGERFALTLTDEDEATVWLPTSMASEKLVVDLQRAGSFRQLAIRSHRSMDKLRNDLNLLRCRHDFAYWAARYVKVKNKEGGEDVALVLTPPQRKYVAELERQRLAGRPIRVVLLKARQWGGSTVTQMYMAWLQLIHQRGLNSLIIAHQSACTDEIMDMYQRMMEDYPVEMLYADAPEGVPKKPVKTEGVGRSRAMIRVPARGCKVKVGTAERPHGCRGGDYALVHLSEVGLWRSTEGKKAEDIVRSACAGVLYRPGTMIVYESTANGTGNFFHKEYVAAKDGEGSQMGAFFVAWHEIATYSVELTDEERRAMAERLWVNRENAYTPSRRQEPGRYLWYLWEQGATLEAIRWYELERGKVDDHAYMAAEYPSDDVEAFVHSGNRVFDQLKVEALREGCRRPIAVGDVIADKRRGGADRGREALIGLHFAEDRQGLLEVWRQPEETPRLRQRYLAVVDVGGRSAKADWSVIAVIDRGAMAQAGGLPEVVAQWRGHTDIDLLAWKAVQIAAYYHNALLVIESNTIESHDPMRCSEADQAPFIFTQIRDVYSNLYARPQSPEQIAQGAALRYGFHTNVSTKPMIISTLIMVVRDGLYVERDQRALEEMLVYEQRQNGSYGAIEGHHDDILMTRAIGLHIAYNSEPPREARCLQPHHHKGIWG